MKTFAERMFGNDKAMQERFETACKEVFGSQAGRLVLACLIRGAHPLAHEPGMNDHQHGNCEVVAALWRGSQYKGFPVLVEQKTSENHVQV